MDKCIYDENNGLWYELQGDYYIPCLTISEEEQRPIGIWGRRHLRYIREHRKALYTGCNIAVEASISTAIFSSLLSCIVHKNP